MVRSWHYTKLSLSNALLLSFSGMFILLFSLVFVVSVLFRYVFCFVFDFALVGALCSCSSDFFLSSRPRTGLAITYITGYG